MASVSVFAPRLEIAPASLPNVVQRLFGAGIDVARVSKMIGFSTAIHTLDPFPFAPACSRMSEMCGRRTILLVRLAGFDATMPPFALVEGLPVSFFERFVSTSFAAMVTLAAAGALVSGADLRGSIEVFLPSRTLSTAGGRSC